MDKMFSWKKAAFLADIGKKIAIFAVVIDFFMPMDMDFVSVKEYAESHGLWFGRLK